MIEYRSGSILREGQPEFVIPSNEILLICQRWLEQAPKLNDEERKVAATMIKYLIVPPIVIRPDQNSL